MSPFDRGLYALQRRPFGTPGLWAVYDLPPMRLDPDGIDFVEMEDLNAYGSQGIDLVVVVKPVAESANEVVVAESLCEGLARFWRPVDRPAQFLGF